MPDVWQAIEDARKLENDGHAEDAFRKFAQIPGGEFAAVALARGDAAKYLTILRQQKDLRENPRARLVEADLLLACGRKDEAKQLYHTLAAAVLKNHWGTGQTDYYPVEPPANPNNDEGLGGSYTYQPALPFCYGPGSHRDNWLLRRLIALDLTDDAANEFARLWEIHRANTRPYVATAPGVDGNNQPQGKSTMVVRPPGFDSHGLQFALDYAFFLKRVGREGDPLAVLLEPFRLMDMDLNPDLTHQQPQPDSELADYPLRDVTANRRFAWGPGNVGVERKEFIRIAYGEFKSSGKEAMLLDDLRRQIERGENRARRVLAQVKIHQGLPDDALALELDYIKLGDFDEGSAAFRRGLVYDSYHKVAEAITAFEQVLTSNPGPVNLPDAEERVAEGTYQAAQAVAFQDDLAVGDRAWPQAVGEAREQLVRLYAAVGRADKVMETELAQFAADESRIGDFDQLEQMANRFKSANQQQQFNEWAKNKLETIALPQAKANLAWMLTDYPLAMTYAAADSNGGYDGWHVWRERFAKLGREQERDFMRAVVKAQPGNAVVRLELLDLEDNLDGAEAIAALEALLATDANEAFPRGKGVWNRTHFLGYFDLAYRLMRLYEKHGKLDKLRALGLRIAQAHKPFGKPDDNNYHPFGSNGPEEFGNACLALAIQHADNNTYLAKLAAALESSRWTGARAQLDRKMHGFPAGDIGGRPVPPWADLPPDVRVVVSCESVTCMARDEAHIYAGLPWGVAVYDFKGDPVTRILLGIPVTALVAAGDDVWAGTQDGLFRIAAGDWSVKREALGLVTALAVDGGKLWIGVRGGVMVLDRNMLELRTFSAEELGGGQTGEIKSFAPDGEYVWADADQGLLRYDRAADAWNAVENPGPRDPAHLIGIIAGQVWADVYLDDEMRHRPARVDRKSLRVTPVQLSGDLTRDQRMINGSLRCIGSDHGKTVFAVHGQHYVLDETGMHIRLMRGDSSGNAMAISDPLPDGMLLPDGSLARHKLPDDRSTGLEIFPKDGKPHRISREAWPDGLHAGTPASAWADRWPSDAVWDVWFDDARRQVWLCVGAGLAVMRDGETALWQFGNAQGVCCGPVLDGVELAGKLYFASGWEDARGGLTVYDPQTRVFTPYFRSDGMDSDKVVGLETMGGLLELRYGVEYLRYNNIGNQRYRQCPPGTFDPATGRFTSGGPPAFPDQMDAEKRSVPPTAGDLPLLGGPAYRRYEHAGQTWWCGERGLVIVPTAKPPAVVFAALNARHLPNVTETLRQEAKQMPIPHPISVEQLKELGASPNRYVRANALAAAMNPVLHGDGEKYLPVLTASMNDSYRNARSTALWLLTRIKSEAVLPPLRQTLDDSDPGIRAVAAIALTNHGEVPPLRFFDDIVARRDGFGNFPFGADSSIGIEADPVRAYAALAPHADRKIFEWLVQRPPPNHDDIKKLYPTLGAALRKHPDAAGVLLGVRDAERYGPLRGFVQGIFQQAGTAMLPVLHEALASDERVVRSNAARACGAIGDASSIPPLVKALDMESGLVRASVVWALGELKARETIPRLIDIYQDARNAEHNRKAGSGFMAQQAVVAHREEYAALRNLDAIASDWEELKVNARPRPHDPRRDEELLTPELVLEAVRKIGPAAAQPFYRALAADSTPGDRAEAAIGLVDAAAADRADNLKILRNLAGDADLAVRIRATTSLLLLDEPGMEQALRDRLSAGDNNERGEILGQLARLPKERLANFRPQIAAIAKNVREPEYLRQRAAALGGK